MSDHKIEKEIKTWLNGIDASKNTHQMYIIAMNDYCKFLDTTAKELIRTYTADIKNGNLMPERAIFHDYSNYV